MFYLLLQEIKLFLNQNWWVFLLFLGCLILIYLTWSWNLVEIILVFLAHFSGDLAVMMMGNYFTLYKQTNDKRYEKYALLAQTVSFVIFWLIGLYAGIFWWKWAYFVPQVLFIWPLLKGFWQLYGLRLLSKVNWIWILLVGIVVLLIYLKIWLIHDVWGLVQVLGFVMFPLGLSLVNQKARYVLSTIGIWLIFVGSLYQLVLGILVGKVSGVDVSYTLLPFAVFVFYLKNLKVFLKRNYLNSK